MATVLSESPHPTTLIIPPLEFLGAPFDPAIEGLIPSTAGVPRNSYGC